MPQSAKEEVQTTALIKGILNGYPGNSAIFREYLQNSDDAGATKQIFILDERQYPTESLLDPVLEDTQGPALIAVNNGVLRDSDWKALKSIHSSSKSTDETQTGKNGLGFRASYHLTENPEVFSGETLMVLDAHREFKEYPGGISINVVSEGHAYSDQLAPFKSVVNDPFQKYEGTAFRLPLRTEKQAGRSQIKPGEPTLIQEIRDLLLGFGSDELEQTVLFLKNIKTIEIRHIKANGLDTFIGRVRVEDVSSLQATLTGLPIRRTTLEMADGAARVRDWCFHHRAFDKAEASRLLSKRLGYDIGDALTAEKLTPNVDIAFPLSGDPIHGSLYTLLPLPIRTGFPVHLNAIFALTPDRQSLKNRQEIGLPHSRERRLIEWNRLIFDEYAPKVWADLLLKVTASLGASACWTAWPSQEYDSESYWVDLPGALVNEVVQRGLCVFPTIAKPRFISLSDRQTLISPTNPSVSLESLASLALDVVQPPSHIYHLLQTSSPRPSASFLSAQRLHEILLDRSPRVSWPSLGNKDVFRDVMDYLVFSSSIPNYSLIIGLPWFYLSNKPAGLIGLTSNVHEQKYFVPATEEEASLFAKHDCLISYDCMSSRLRNVLLLPDSSKYLNVAPLNPMEVISYLKVNSNPDVPWVIRFWTWLERWEKRKLFFKRLLACGGSLPLLPTASGAVRKVSDKMVSFQDTDDASVASWKTVGVYGPHSDLTNQVVAMLRDHSLIVSPRSPDYIPLLLRSCNPTLMSGLTPTTSFRDSFYNGLPPYGEVSPLRKEDKYVLESLPIFSVRDPTDGRPSLGCVNGSRIHVSIPDQEFPLPFLLRFPPVIYIDTNDYKTKCLAQLLEPIAPKDTFGLLTLAIDHWNDQNFDLQGKFVEEMVRHWYRLPAGLKSRLKDLPFVTVNGLDKRVKPHGLINPKSSLRILYTGEPGKIPSGRFEEDDYIAVMQSAGFFPSSLTERVVSERLAYLSSAPRNAYTIEKSRHLFEQLNQSWSQAFCDAVRSHRSSEWLPAASGLLAPHASRDDYVGENANPHFYDLALTLLQKSSATSRGLRTALGWSDTVPFGILADQLRLTIELSHSHQRVRRLEDMLQYLSALFERNHLSGREMEILRAVVADKSWIPVSYTETVPSRYALLGESGLKPPFRPIRQLEMSRFLRQMGCHDQPLTATLLDELKKRPSPQPSEVDLVVSLLHEISKSPSNVDQSLLWVLGRDLRLHRFEDVYFPDVHQLFVPDALKDKVGTHQAISRTLADALEIQTLSALILQLGDLDDSDDEEQMSEDLTGRIRGFLREYDERYAFNEFLANAHDAGAKKFSIAISNPWPPSTTTNGLQVISPEFSGLRGCHSLILHNDALMSDADFKGLRQVGQGGKLDQLDTHGRHGLGALSFYYFSDVAIVLSGKYVMILDPSARYLPRTRRGGRRTALKRTLEEMISSYPDQLAPYENVLGFSVKERHYAGTLFCLPLSSTTRDCRSFICERPCNLAATIAHINQTYRELARNAFYFTRLERISAWDGIQPIWEASASRSAVRELQDSSFTREDVRISSHHTGTSTESWIVATSTVSIPIEHTSTALSLKLGPQSKLKVQLALRLPSGSNIEERYNTPKDHYLFSTLRLPKTTSLPFHLNARFAISSNRQNLVFAPPDSSGKLDAKSSFNAWILDVVVPPLYLATLEHLISKAEMRRQFFRNVWWLIHPRDEISKLVSASFFRHLPSSTARLFEATRSEGTLLSFQESVFSIHEPQEVCEILKTIKIPKVVTLLRRLPIVHNLKDIKYMKTIDPPFVKGALLGAIPAEIQRGSECDGPTFEKQIMATLGYIRGEPPFPGLPLAILTSGALVSVPGMNDPPIYFSERSHASLFPTTRFLRASYDSETIRALLDDLSTHILELTQDTVMPLFIQEFEGLPDDNARRRLLETFWSLYSTLPGPPDLSSIEQSDYKVVQGVSRNLSLKECQPGQILLLNNAGKPPEWILAASQKLGIETVSVKSNRSLRGYLSKRFSDDIFTDFLKCLETIGVSRINGTITENERKELRAGIASRLSDWRRCDPGVSKGYLRSLKLWESWSTSGDQVSSADELVNAILPSFFPLASIKRYLAPGHSISEYSSNLTEFIAYPRPRKRKAAPTFVMSPADMLKVIRWPERLSEEQEVHAFKDFLDNMLGFSLCSFPSKSLYVPDTDGVLRLFSDLYDHNVPLFSTTLVFTENSSFMHEEFRATGRLSMRAARQLGLQHEVTLLTFQRCAQTVQQAFEMHLRGQEHPTRTEVTNMARITFNQYCTALPSLLMTNRGAWNSLDEISFVLRDDSRRRGASYYVDPYCGPRLSLLLPPSRFLLRKYEPVAWTQRALFLEDEEPEDDILAVHRNLGVPGISEVVEHLRILATQIGLDHPKDRTLIFDLKATYEWLNERADQAGQYLAPFVDERLFLNVVDPIEDTWDGQWSAASELVLNMHYDTNRKKRVNSFLRKYDALLRAAGCKTLNLQSVREERLAPATTGTSSHLRDAFDRMRKDGIFLDVMFVHAPDSPETEGFQIPAHKAFVAAAIPHFREMTSQGLDAKEGKFEFEGTKFGAEALLNFIYTGDFQIDAPEDNAEAYMILLRDLLELLPIADRWGMEEMKAKIEWSIIHKYDMIQRLPDSEAFNLISEEAIKYHADGLKEALEEFKRKNGELLD
ncbi:unnamed protein product [Cyclocybe aegerita]|uniref:BTB domain-containing protein n=1 Tax=Cyclocybe aegerita TaxID=1973307 RepID=A0A8S0XNE0_CYCAE|nr:unnamed protein product [Cyclocybe aegerita]